MATLGLTLLVIAMIDVAHNRDAYQQQLADCYFDHGCTLNPREFARFLDMQKRDILEGTNGR